MVSDRFNAAPRRDAQSGGWGEGPHSDSSSALAQQPLLLLQKGLSAAVGGNLSAEAASVEGAGIGQPPLQTQMLLPTDISLLVQHLAQTQAAAASQRALPFSLPGAQQRLQQTQQQLHALLLHQTQQQTQELHQQRLHHAQLLQQSGLLLDATSTAAGALHAAAVQTGGAEGGLDVSATNTALGRAASARSRAAAVGISAASGGHRGGGTGAAKSRRKNAAAAVGGWPPNEPACASTSLSAAQQHHPQQQRPHFLRNFSAAAASQTQAVLDHQQQRPLHQTPLNEMQRQQQQLEQTQIILGEEGASSLQELGRAAAQLACRHQQQSLISGSGFPT